MTRLHLAADRTFRSLHTPNFRLYFGGQIVSATGSWMQTVAQAWLVLRLTGSGVALGVVTALQFLPMLVGGAWAGVLVDRLDKRRLLVATAAVAGVLALAAGVLALAGLVTVWMLFGFAFLLGCVTAIDNPARRAFVPELVEPDDMANAVGLNSAVFTAARVVGPALAGLVIAGAGAGWCFVIDGVSFLAVIAALVRMRSVDLRVAPAVARATGQLRAGLRYAWQTREVRLALAMVAVVSTLAFNFQIVLPLLARDLGAGPATFGTLFGVMGVGSLAGALFAAHRARASTPTMIGASGALGAGLLIGAAAPTLAAEMLVVVGIGLASMVFMAMATAVVQERTEPAMRGRVMALFGVAFLGSTPIGGPLVGWVSQALGARAGLALGGVAALGAAAVAAVAIWRRPLAATDEDGPADVPHAADALALVRPSAA